MKVQNRHGWLQRTSWGFGFVAALVSFSGLLGCDKSSGGGQALNPPGQTEAASAAPATAGSAPAPAEAIPEGQPVDSKAEAPPLPSGEAAKSADAAPSTSPATSAVGASAADGNDVGASGTPPVGGAPGQGSSGSSGATRFGTATQAGEDRQVTTGAHLKTLASKIRGDFYPLDNLSRCERAKSSDPRIVHRTGSGAATEGFHTRRECRSSRVLELESLMDKQGGLWISATQAARDGRCTLALCWGPKKKWGFEPIAELPLGVAFAVPSSGLARFRNEAGLDVSFVAGLRVWLFWDVVSLDIHYAKPLIDGADSLRIGGSGFDYPSGQIRRPAPGLGLGLLLDLLWIGVDVEQLRNGDSASTRDPLFPPNSVVSTAVVFTIGISPVSAARSALGLAKDKGKEKEKEKEKERDLDLDRGSSPTAERESALILGGAPATPSERSVETPLVGVPASPSGDGGGEGAQGEGTGGTTDSRGEL